MNEFWFISDVSDLATAVPIHNVVFPLNADAVDTFPILLDMTPQVKWVQRLLLLRDNCSYVKIPFKILFVIRI